jgi:phosphoenolpyruvate carboxykinase (ATP)
VFGIEVPTTVPDVPSNVLDPRGTWSDGAAYDAQARKLAGMFRDNFKQFKDVPSAVQGAGPGE